MEKKMGEAVARVAKKVNETVENQADSLDLADCKLMTFPIALYKVMRHVAEGIHLITLANNELKSVTGKFIITFSQLRELNLEGNYIHHLPEEVRTLLHLRTINLSRNKFHIFPDQLTSLQALEMINLEENEITEFRSITASDRKAVQRVVMMAEKIIGSSLPSIQNIAQKRCLSRVRKIVWDAPHLLHDLFSLLPWYPKQNIQIQSQLCSIQY